MVRTLWRAEGAAGRRDDELEDSFPLADVGSGRNLLCGPAIRLQLRDPIGGLCVHPRE